MEDPQVQHLQMIQAVITRMATNSFMLKGWSVTLVSALLALSAAGTTNDVALLAYFPAVAFWFLDAYFLHQERKFRALYDSVRSQSGTDFSMQAGPADPIGWFRAVVTPTRLVFHLTIMFAILGKSILMR